MAKPLILRSAVAGLLLAALAGCASQRTGAAPGGHATATPSTSGSVVRQSAPVVRTFSPYDGSGALTVPVTGRGSGSCWTNSITVREPGAYRCLVGDQIGDPCFAPSPQTAPPTVACLRDPWSGATVVTLTGALPSAGPAATRLPWALQLANGARCVLAGGTVPAVGGVSLPYLCGSGMAAGFGTSTGTPSQVEYGSQDGGPLTGVAISTIWRG